MDLNESFVNWFIVVIVSVFVIFTILKNLNDRLITRMSEQDLTFESLHFKEVSK